MKIRYARTMKWLNAVALSAALSGCAWLQSTRLPTVAEGLAWDPWALARLAETGQADALQGSEITVLVPPAEPRAYWACLHRPDHRHAEIEEVSRWVLGVRWRPVVPAGDLRLHAQGGTWLILSSDGPDRGRVNGVPIQGRIEHLANGNLAYLAAPLPPLDGNPCRRWWSASHAPAA